MENNSSGLGKESEIPIEIQGWNWGAFLLTWIWGIGNNTYRAFWIFFPIVNFFMAIALGLKGNEWAWRNRRWESIEHFKRVQRQWTKAGIIVIAVMFFFFFIIIFGINEIFKTSEAYKMSFDRITNSKEVISHIGSPIKAGFVSGNIRVSGPQGFANISYSIEGSKGEGVVAIKAIEELNSWSIECLIVNYNNSNDQTVLVPCKWNTNKEQPQP
jgi:hypothetical protein